MSTFAERQTAVTPWRHDCNDCWKYGRNHCSWALSLLVYSAPIGYFNLLTREFTRIPFWGKASDSNHSSVTLLALLSLLLVGLTLRNVRTCFAYLTLNEW